MVKVLRKIAITSILMCLWFGFFTINQVLPNDASSEYEYYYAYLGDSILIDKWACGKETPHCHLGGAELFYQNTKKSLNYRKYRGKDLVSLFVKPKIKKFAQDSAFAFPKKTTDYNTLVDQFLKLERTIGFKLVEQSFAALQNGQIEPTVIHHLRSLENQQFSPSFVMIDQTLNQLKKEGLPEEILEQLSVLKHHEFEEKEFVQALDSILEKNIFLGDRERINYKEQILTAALSGGQQKFIRAIQRIIGQEKTILYQEQILDAAQKDNIPDLMTITIGRSDLVVLLTDLIKNPRDVDKIIEFSSGYRKTLRLIKTKVKTLQRDKRGLTSKINKKLDVIVLNIYDPTDQTDCLFKTEPSFKKRMYGLLKRTNQQLQFFAKKNKYHFLDIHQKFFTHGCKAFDQEKANNPEYWYQINPPTEVNKYGAEQLRAMLSETFIEIIYPRVPFEIKSPFSGNSTKQEDQIKFLSMLQNNHDLFEIGKQVQAFISRHGLYSFRNFRELKNLDETYKIGVVFDQGYVVIPNERLAEYWFRQNHKILQEQNNIIEAIKGLENEEDSPVLGEFLKNYDASFPLAPLEKMNGFQNRLTSENKRNLGYYLLKNRNKKFLFWIHEAVIDGDVDAMVKLGLIYRKERNLGVEPDLKMALTMFEKATKQALNDEDQLGYRISNSSLKNFQKSQIEPSVINGLKTLKNRVYKDEGTFLRVIQKKIGKEKIDQYKEPILRFSKYQQPLLEFAKTMIIGKTGTKSQVRYALDLFEKLDLAQEYEKEFNDLKNLL